MDLQLPDFLRETVPILQHGLRPSVRVETVLPEDILHIKADHTQMQSEPDKGTVVRICIPAVIVETKKEERPKSGPSKNSATILVIEDEDMVVGIVQAMLEALEYRVLVAKTGREAIHMTETFQGRIDLALLDVKLPDMEGGKLYPLIMKVRPNLKVIVSSGFSIEGPVGEILDAGAEGFIQKPFSLAGLSEKLKEVLDQP